MKGETDFHGTPAVRLQAEDGTEAIVVPAIGANCVALRVPLPEGSPQGSPQGSGPAHLLSTPASAAALRAHGTGSGFPILWPHPGMNRAPFTWRGRTYEPPGATGRLAGHGFLAAAEWQIADVSESALVSRLDTRTLDPATAWWPWPFVVTATHRLAAGSLTLTLDFVNLGDDVAPMMCGLHPYFPLRFLAPPTADGGAAGALPTAADLAGADEAGARETCHVWVEADTLWDLSQGRASGVTRPAGERWDVRRPRSLAALAQTAALAGVAQANGRMPVLLYGTTAALDGARTGEDPAGPGGISSGVVDTAAGLKLTFETSRAFGTVALYTPAGHAAVSLEPRSALPDALTLAAADPGMATGVRAVEPGETWRASARLSLTRT